MLEVVEAACHSSAAKALFLLVGVNVVSHGMKWVLNRHIHRQWCSRAVCPVLKTDNPSTVSINGFLGGFVDHISCPMIVGAELLAVMFSG